MTELDRLRQAYDLMSQGRNDAIDDLALERQETRRLQTVNEHLLLGMEHLLYRYRRCGIISREEAEARGQAEAGGAQERLDERDAAEDTEP